ncbi:MAG: Calx-beta domain-containing protein [Amphiplicatus sp.]
MFVACRRGLILLKGATIRYSIDLAAIAAACICASGLGVPALAQAYEYDVLGRVVSATYPNGETVEYAYDAAGNRIVETTEGLPDNTPSFSVNNVAVTEGGTLAFTVTKTGATLLTHAVNYGTAGDTATSGVDFTAASGTLTFTMSETSKVVNVSTAQETTYEANETLYLNLSTPTNGATIGDGQGVGTINNDDPFVQYVRDYWGILQPGYTQHTQEIPSLNQYIHRTKEGSFVIHTAVHEFEGDGYCDQSGTLSSGYSWTGNGCELRED